MSRTSKGYLIALVGITFWSTNAIFVSYLITRHNLSPLLLALWRDILVSLALGAVLWARRRATLRVSRADLSFLILYGLTLGLFNAIWTLSVKLSGAAVATVLVYGSTAFTALLAWRLFGERLGLAKVTAVVLALGGCVLVAEAYDPAVWQVNPLGIVAGLLSGLGFALYSLTGKETARRGVDPWAALFYAFTFASLLLVVLNLIPAVPNSAGSVGSLWPALNSTGWAILLVLSLVPTLLGYGLYMVALNYLAASIANLLATLEPVMTAVEAYLLLGERLTELQVVGSVLIIAAVFVVHVGEGSPPAPLE
ncbi:MAG: EamA/RhaT family transporter [Chloroflexi bacterium]|nr:EamA/RhaT family transporter [Chloroflexota bacterium]